MPFVRPTAPQNNHVAFVLPIPDPRLVGARDVRVGYGVLVVCGWRDERCDPADVTVQGPNQWLSARCRSS